jgi:phage repressor protein C with HTH and peptisase S24 domain
MFSVAETAVEYGDFIFVPQMADRISAGGGVVHYNDVEVRVAFRKDWIRGKGDPENMSLIKVVGDSMEPSLLSGDLVLVDHGRTRVDPQGGIYAIAIDHEIMIKRIQPVHYMGTLKIISDNKKYGPIEADADCVNINGKVIWFARDIER